MTLGLNLTFIGLLVVFVGLSGLAILMFVVGILLKKQKTNRLEVKSIKQDELAVISLAIYLTKLFNEQDALEFKIKHKTSSSWFMSRFWN